MPQKVNLVFQGGGVKGIAFAGALTALEELPEPKDAIIVEGVGGVSVGALAAVLYAAGYTAPELSRALREKPVASLLRERPPFNRAHAAWRLWRRRGLYSTNEIATWVDGLLKAKGVIRFGDLKKEDCRIVAANVTDGSYETYKKKENARDFVVPAVIKSLSIPLFFTPYADGDLRLFVDGGLLSNYPLWLFADSPLVTIGLKLGGPPAHGATMKSGLFDYLRSLLATMLSAHDQSGRGKPPNCVEIPINAAFVPSTNFAVEDTEQERLFERGKLAVAEFKWRNLPATRRVVFNDPHAGEILEEAANNIEKLFNRLTKNKRRYEKFELKHYIEDNGWATMHWHYVLTNGGPGPISMLAYRFEYADPQSISFKDLGLTVDCGPAPYDVVALPIQNTSLGKGFAVAFIPPIAPGESREVTIKYRSPDFQKLVQRERDLLEVEIGHEEGIGVATVSVELPRRLGRLVASGGRGQTQSVVQEEFETGEAQGYVWRFRDLTTPLHLKVDLDLR